MVGPRQWQAATVADLGRGSETVTVTASDSLQSAAVARLPGTGGSTSFVAALH